MAAQHLGGQEGGAQLPLTEARTFTPTFCFTSGLAWLVAPPRIGSPDTDLFHSPGEVTSLSPVASTSCSENFIPGYQELLPRVAGRWWRQQ